MKKVDLWKLNCYMILIIVFLAAMPLPALQEESGKDGYTRWLTYKNKLCSDSSLIAYYTFEEGEGILLRNRAIGGPQNVGYVPEKMDGEIVGATWVKNGGRWTEKNVLEFDGFVDYINCGHDKSWHITDAITIEAWIKPTPPHEEGYGGIFCNLVGYAGSRLLVKNNGKLLSQVGINDTTQNVWGAAITNNIWNYVVYVYDGSHEVWYSNGTKGRLYPTTGTINTGTADVIIGWGTSQFGYYHFKGKIGEVAIYDRALSADEIKTHYEMGKP